MAARTTDAAGLTPRPRSVVGPSGEPRDVEAMFTRYRPLASRLARRYTGTSAGLEDLEQVACVGLVKAIRRFDPDRGCAFSTFAVPTVLGELRHYCRDTAWSAHVPRPVQERVRAVRAAADAHAAHDGRPPSAAEVGLQLGLDEEQVADALCAASALAPVSLDADRGDEEDAGPLLERLGAEEPGYELAECRAVLERVLPLLSDAQRQLLRLRYADGLSQEEIGSRLGLPAGRVARRLRAALDELAALLGVDGGDPPALARAA